jgi:hypothetical protein
MLSCSRWVAWSVPVEAELAQRGELAFEAVYRRGVRGRAGDLGVAGRGLLPTRLSFLAESCGLKLS